MGLLTNGDVKSGISTHFTSTGLPSGFKEQDVEIQRDNELGEASDAGSQERNRNTSAVPPCSCRWHHPGFPRQTIE